MGDVIHFPPRAVDYVAFLPDATDKGKPKATVENLAEICARLGATIRYNDISKTREILFPGRGFALDNKENVSLGWLISECEKFGMSTRHVSRFVGCLAEANHFNPVATWIESRPWDGEDRFTDLLETIVAKNESTDALVKAMKEVFLRKWMLSAVAAAYQPDGVSAHGVLVFQGQQYVGKTKWFKSLVPSDLGLLKDGVLLRPDDRDSVMKCVQYWLVELGELDATFRKADIASLKSFLTSDHDVLRRSHAEFESHYPRRTVFFASVNPQNFLHDDTGNRRYWTIAVDKLDYDHTIDMQQVWAQVAVGYHKGESWYLSGDEFKTLTLQNTEFEASDPIGEIAASRLEWEALENFWDWRTSTDILADCGYKAPNKSDVTRLAVEIRRRNGNRSKRSSDARFLYVPPLRIKR